VTKQTAGAHVLIVEDNPDLREGLGDLLEAEGYAVAGAANGQEALARLQSEPPPCLILLDLMMPVMNGWEFRAAQRRDPALAEIPVVLISALEGLERLAGNLAAAGYLRKPLDLGTLLEIVARYHH
jgi:CheY-like chemotaxis protein